MWYRAKISLAVVCLIMFASVAGCNSGLSESQVKPTGELENQALRTVRNCLEDQNPMIRSRAVEVVASTNRTELMPKVAELLKDGYVPVRFAALLAIGDTRYTPARSQARQLLGDEDENVQIAAAYAMVRFGQKQYVDRIRVAIKSKDKRLKQMPHCF